MGRTQALDELKGKNYSWIGSKYYDYPDGEDLLGKLKYTTTISGFTGLIIGSVAVSQREFLKKPLSAKLVETAKIFVPCVGMAAVFTAVTFFSTRIRQKDDELNYVMGGLASGAVLGAAAPRIFLGFTGALVFACLGYAKKHHQLRGEVMLPKIYHTQFPSYFERKLNTSLIPLIKGNWTKDP